MQSVRVTFLLLFCSAVVKCEVLGAISKLVNITQGPVRGYRDPEGIFVFYSIPYATAPTGPDKFKAPLPPPTWSKPFEAVDKAIICPQVYRPLLSKINKSEQEDCLIINVYVPDTEALNLPVVVYIHGGRFNSLFGNAVRPKNVVRNKNVIVVNFNYRLGVYGFLCLGTKDVPGNAGLKDQLAALQWVKTNIAAFGGNTNDVTLAGYSSGAACADIIALSPAASGLFNKVIVDSAVSLMNPGLVNDPLENAKMFAVYLGFNNTDDIYALESFYKTSSLETLLRGDAVSYSDMRLDSTFLFAPCIERDTEGKEIKILTEPPYQILKKGSYKQVPMLYGFNKMDASFYVDKFENWKSGMNENFSDYLPGTLKFNSRNQKESIANMAQKLYFGNEPINANSILKYIDYFTDIVFKNPLLRLVKMHLEAGHDNIFLYEYSFVDEDMPIIPFTNVRDHPHPSQVFAILDGKYLGKYLEAQDDKNITDDFKEFKRIYRDYWTNFVKTGSPMPEESCLPAWPSVVGHSLTPYMEVTLPPRLRWTWDEQLLNRMRFWDSLFDHYYREPIPPQL